jgi:hypothetical protein
MTAWLKRLFCSKETEKLEQTIKDLQIKLAERQEAINKTNAYWKKKMAEVNRKQKNP